MSVKCPLLIISLLKVFFLTRFFGQSIKYLCAHCDLPLPVRPLRSYDVTIFSPLALSVRAKMTNIVLINYENKTSKLFIFLRWDCYTSFIPHDNCSLFVDNPDVRGQIFVYNTNHTALKLVRYQFCYLREFFYFSSYIKMFQ